MQVGLGGVDTGAVPGSDVCALDAGAYGYANSAAFVPDTLYDFFGFVNPTITLCHGIGSRHVG